MDRWLVGLWESFQAIKKALNASALASLEHLQAAWSKTQCKSMQVPKAPTTYFTS